MTVKERITEYLNYKGISTYQFEKSIGKTKSYFRNTKNITSDVCALVCERYPDLSPDWLLRGTGEMISTGTESTEGNVPMAEDTGTRKRLLDFIDYLGMSHPTFEAKAQLARGTISHIKYGISSSNLKKISIVFPQLDIYWLIGVGGHDMIRKDFDENNALKDRIDKLIEVISRQYIQ